MPLPIIDVVGLSDNTWGTPAEAWQQMGMQMETMKYNKVLPYHQIGVRAAELALTKKGQQRVAQIEGALRSVAESLVPRTQKIEISAPFGIGMGEVPAERDARLERERVANEERLQKERETRPGLVQQCLEKYLTGEAVVEANGPEEKIVVGAIDPNNPKHGDVMTIFNHDLSAYRAAREYQQALEGQVTEGASLALPGAVTPTGGKLNILKSSGVTMDDLSRAFQLGWASVQPDLPEVSGSSVS